MSLVTLSLVFFLHQIVGEEGIDWVQLAVTYLGPLLSTGITYLAVVVWKKVQPLVKREILIAVVVPCISAVMAIIGNLVGVDSNPVVLMLGNLAATFFDQLKNKITKPEEKGPSPAVIPQ